jgi:hypothetical protein
MLQVGATGMNNNNNNKNNNSNIFLFAAQPKEFFLDGLNNLEQRSHKYVEFRGNM